MAKIEFKAKAVEVFTPDNKFSHREITVPVLTRKHCDMEAFRTHPQYGSYANSDLFAGVLSRIRRDRLGAVLRVETPPPGVLIDTSGFLARVTVEV